MLWNSLYSAEIKYEEIEEDVSNHKGGSGGKYAGKYDQPRCCPFCDQGGSKSLTALWFFHVSKSPTIPPNFKKVTHSQ